MSSAATTGTTANRQQLYRQTLRILNTNSLHFILISVLFIPFTFSASAAAQFYSARPHTATDADFDPFNLFLIKTIIANSQNILTIKTLITLLTFTFFVVLPTVAGIGLITYSTNKAINGEPLRFSSTIRSLSNSFIPLLSTIISGSIKLILIFIIFTLSPITVTELIKILGFHIDLSVVSFFLNTILSFSLAIIILYFIVIWGSAASISVLESKSLFKPLQQSANQSEFRSHSFSIVYITVFNLGTALWCSTVPPSFEQISILQVGVVYLQSSLMMLLYAVANTVLYVQCKVARVEDASGAYVSVAVKEKDDEVSGDVAKENDAPGGFSYMMYLVIILWMIILFFTFYKLYTYIK